MIPTPQPPSTSPWKKRLLLLAGLALAAIAVHQAWQPATLLAISRHLQSLSGWAMIASILILSLANLWLTALLFWLVHRGFPADPPVGFRSMLGLIQASALMNYLPLGWPGPLARSAYLKWRHAMPVSQSMLALGVVLGLSLLAAAMAVVSAMGQTDRWISLSMAACAGVWAMIAAIIRWRFPGRWPGFFLTLPVKLLDLTISAIRLKLALTLLGQPVDFASAMLLAAPEMLVSMLSPTPSGLGVSEWTVGSLASWMELASSPIAASAKLLDRALSLLVLLPLGFSSLRVLARNHPSR